MKTIELVKSISEIALLKNVSISFTPEEEDLNIFGHFGDEEVAQNIANRYNNGNFAAWFCAKVTVKTRDFEETDYLGGCSYNSFKEFTNEENGYYIDMINLCIGQINKDILIQNEEIQKAWNIRKAKNLISKYGLFIVPNLNAIAL